MDYREALVYINNIQLSLGSEYSLKDVTELCRRVGRPDRKLQIIHLAGTNGKGSVGTYLSNILAEAGYTVGRYLSPTILDYRERIQRILPKDKKSWKGLSESVYRRELLQENFVSKEEVAQKLTILRKECEEMVAQGFGQPTAFEIETVMAFMLFAEWKCDVVIAEAGLGGRMDATNFIDAPLMCILTSISRDHMGILGDTIEQIAAEKYGIIKEGAIVVSDRQENCYPLLSSCCQSKNAVLHLVQRKEFAVKEKRLNQNRFTYYGKEYVLEQNGIYQMDNALLAITAAYVLQENGFEKISYAGIRNALAESFWYGRFEVVSEEPFVLADGAHNEDGAKRLRESLETYFPNEKFILVAGMFRDKEYQKILEIMLPLGKKLYTIATKGQRTLTAEQLRETAQKISGAEGKIPIEECKSLNEALDMAGKEAAHTRMVIFGSLSFIQEIYAYYEKKERIDDEDRK